MKKTLLSVMAVTLFYGLSFSQTTFSTKQTINNASGSYPYVIDSGELSGDTFNDIVIGTYGNTIEWYKNNADGTFTLQTLVSTTLDSPSGIHIADLNNDSYNDIIATSYSDDKVVWYANDGVGNFGTEQVIYTGTAITGPGTVKTGYIDGDTTLDIVVTGYESNQTVWFANDVANSTFSSPNVIAFEASSGPGDFDLTDFDSDGDTDVVIANSGSGTIEVYNNNLVGSATVSFTKYTNTVDVGNTYLFNISFADVNDDNVMDILKSDIGGVGQVAYYSPTTSGLATTFTETSLSVSGVTIDRPATATAVDIDNDGYVDVISSNAGTTGYDLEWFESTNTGTFNAVSEIDSSQNIIYGVTISDFDNDGDLDIATIDYQNSDLNWFENELETLSVSDFNTNAISFYPNPAKNTLNFKGDFTSETNISIFDVLGKQVMNAVIDASTTLDISQLNSGLYILKFEKNAETFKFIKE